MSISDFFNRSTHRVAMIAGKPATIVTAILAVLIWAILGPILDYSEGWQLTINTATTIITFLMVFIIQNSQNRESLAVQIKLNELLRSSSSAKNVLFDAEELSAEELEQLRQQYEALSAAIREHKAEGKGIPAISLPTPVDIETAGKEEVKKAQRVQTKRKRVKR